jgi:hypothetical protein
VEATVMSLVSVYVVDLILATFLLCQDRSVRNIVLSWQETQVEGDPKPIVLIDQDSNPHATTVEISFGDRLGALLDTVQSLISFLFGYNYKNLSENLRDAFGGVLFWNKIHY